MYEIKDLIIDKTIELIKAYDGNVAKITTRKIAKRANIAIGLINYYFNSKNELITDAIQQIIKNVVTSFRPNIIDVSGMSDFEACKNKLCACAKEVFEFLYANPSISKLSILGDYDNFVKKSNTYLTMLGFSSIMGNYFSSAKKIEISYELTSLMQNTFLKTYRNKNILGYDFASKEDRERYIEHLIDLLYRER